LRIALPLFGTRVAPRCLYAESMLLVSVSNGKVNSRVARDTSGLSNDEWVDMLVELGIGMLICGAVPAHFRDEATARGVEIITNIAGEADDIINQLVKGTLAPGYGLSSKIAESENPKDKLLDSIDCIRCMDRVCLRGGKCRKGMETIIPPGNNGDIRKTLEVATDVALEKDPKLCRVAELVHYGIGMQYKNIGLAFCVEMFREAEILVGVLRRFFDVTPVCCKVGGITAEDVDLPEGPQDLVCNVVGQAHILNMKNTELNVIAGLCVGCDTLFTQYSKAPVTTLFVKDKSLANNPVGALFSKYYLDDLASEF